MADKYEGPVAVTFTKDAFYDLGGPAKGPTYKAGETRSFREDIAQRWIRRGVAVAADEYVTPAAEDEAADANAEEAARKAAEAEAAAKAKAEEAAKSEAAKKLAAAKAATRKAPAARGTGAGA